MNRRISQIAAGIGMCMMAVILSTGLIYAQEPYMEQSFSVNDNARLEVETSGGSIDVQGSNTDAVRVEMYVKRRGKHVEPGEADLDNWDITVEKNGNTVYAKAKRRGRGGWGNNSYNVSFVVYTPVSITTDLRTSGGSISLENLTGNQDAKTSGGRITARQIGGDLEVNTSGGSITIEEIEGYVDAKTSGGRISAANVTGGITARTSGGSINLDNISGNVEAKTSGGSIDAEVIEPMDYIELRTSGGSISITVPKNAGYDLDLDGNRVRADLVDFRGDYDKDEMQGTMNGGGTRVKAKTSGGSVTLRYM